MNSFKVGTAMGLEYMEQSHELAKFDLGDVITCGATIRRLGLDCQSMEETAGRIAAYLYNTLVNEEGRRCCPLVRCYKTHPLRTLPPELMAIARDAAAARGEMTPADGMPCLTLLATSGDARQWAYRSLVRPEQQVMPLGSQGMVEEVPLLARMLQQLGLPMEGLLRPDEVFLLEGERRSLNVFFVAEAAGSPYVPEQRGFVDVWKIRSVLGFGGLLPSGDLFAFLLFSRVGIDAKTAEMFRTVALSAKLALLPFTRGPIFEGHTGGTHIGGEEEEREQARAGTTTLGLLIPELEAIAMRKTQALNCSLAQLSEEASRDCLTELANRRTLDLVLHREFSRAMFDGRPLSVLMVDVDQFKLFNDRYGHPAGDGCLKRVAKLLTCSARRPTDLVARYGGEEFCVLLPGTDLKGAIRVADVARQAVADAAIEHAASGLGRVTISIGCAVVMGDGNDSPVQLVKRADEFLYQAKREGRNRTFPRLEDLESPVIEL